MNTLIPMKKQTEAFKKAWAPPSNGDLDCPARANPSNATNGECISLENQDRKQWTIVAGNEPANPCCFEVGGLGKVTSFFIWVSSSPCVCFTADMVIRWGQHRELQVVSCNQSTTLGNIYQSWRRQQSSHGYPSVVTKTIVLTHSDSQLILPSTQSHRIIHENKLLPQGATDQPFLESKHPSSVAEKKLCKQAANGGTSIVSFYKARSSPVVNL